MIDETFIRNNIFNMLKILRRTRLIATDANVRKRIYTNSTTIDDEHILMGTYFTQVLFASTRKLTSGSSMCEEAFKYLIIVIIVC